MALKANACTIFCATNRNAVLVGNNEDGPSKFPSKMWFVPAGKFGYGRVCFGWYSHAQGGMNDHGLFMDWAALPDPVTPPKRSGKLPPDGCMAERVLATCGSVEEAVRVFETIEYIGNAAHFLVADSTGETVVGEWIDGEFKPIRKRGKQMITNFPLANPKAGYYPCPRYETVASILEKDPKVSADLFASILNKTSAKWDGGGTKYSNVYDLTHRKVTVYSDGDFVHAMAIDLKTELQRGLREIDLKTLFANGRKELEPARPKRKNIKVPPAESLIDRFIEARGGTAAVQLVRSYRMGGRMSEAWGDTGEWEIAAAPGLRSEKFAFKKLGLFRNGCDGKEAWQDDPLNGPRLISGAILQHAQRDADFFNWQHDPQQYTSMESLGVQTFEGKDCFAVRLTTRAGLQAVHYFDVDSGLLKGIVGTTALRSGTTWARVIYEDYQKTDGVLFPKRIRVNEEGFDMSLEATSMTLNERIAFAMPDAVATISEAGR